MLPFRVRLYAMSPPTPGTTSLSHVWGSALKDNNCVVAPPVSGITSTNMINKMLPQQIKTKSNLNNGKKRRS